MFLRGKRGERRRRFSSARLCETEKAANLPDGSAVASRQVNGIALCKGEHQLFRDTRHPSPVLLGCSANGESRNRVFGDRQPTTEALDYTLLPSRQPFISAGPCWM